MTKIRSQQIDSRAATDGYVLTADGSGGAAWEASAGGGMTNPMTTPADLIVGGTAGAPARLAKGADGTVLTVDPATHLLVWAAPTGGMANPMTTVGDLILGGAVTGGVAAPSRLAAATAGKVLTANGAGAAPTWETPVSGFADPTTTKGDLIVHGASTTRLPVSGHNGYVLTEDSTQAAGVKWAAGGAGGGNVTITFAGSTTSEGVDQNRSTAGSYNALQGYIIVQRPIKLHQILWDVKSAGTYTLTLKDGAGTTLDTIGPSTVAGTTADLAFTLTSDLVLRQGRYSLTLTKSSTATTWSDYNSAAAIYVDAIQLVSGVNYDATPSAYVLPVKLVFYDGAWTVA